MICRNREEAARTAGELQKLIPLAESDLEKAVFGSGIMVLPVEFTKGLEFDAVLLLDPTRAAYPSDDGNARLLYVAATRALHELCVLHEGDLTGLIADPVPEKPVQKMEKGAASRTEKTKALPKEKPTSAGRTGGSPDSQKKKRISIVRNEIPRNPVPEREQPSAARQERPSSALRTKPSASLRSPASASKVNVRKPYESYAEAEKRGVTEAGRTWGSTGRLSGGFPAFGDMPSADHLRPAGRPRTDLAVRWSSMNPDGLYLQSRYGVLRLCPVGSAIVRVTFVKGSQMPKGICPGIAVNRMEKNWKLRDTRTAVEFSGTELCLQVDKASGAVRYLSGEKKPLLSERSRDCRLIEDSGAQPRAWLYLDRTKGEKLYAPGMQGEKGISLNASARYISHGGAEFPLLLSENGYGMLIASRKPVISCDIPLYGACLCAEGEQMLDFYFIAGKQQLTIMNAYAYLCGLI